MTITIKDVVLFLVVNGPGRTQRQLAEAIFGAAGYQQRVNVECEMLTRSGEIDRRGDGGPSDPFTYHAVSR